MKPQNIFLLLILLSILFPFKTHAYWPTTVEENLVISADPNLFEWAPATVPLAGEKIGVFFKLEGPGACCQIIDRFGELVLETPQPLLPGLDSTHHGAPHAIPDGAGGAMICCAEGPDYSTLIPGIFAQRVDSLGNLMWGDEGIRIFQIYEGTFDICPDGEGGMYLGIIPDDPAGVEGQFWLQRVDEAGNLLFGDSGIVAIYNPNGVIHPHIASDDAGGCYLVWEVTQGLQAQRFDGSGNPMWPSNLQIEIQGPSWHFEIIPDGENGLIVQTNYGADWNTLRRISPTGSFLWTRTHLTWYQDAQIMPGEPGFFYAGFTFFGGMVYGQKIDLQGNPHWTSWPQAYGALMYNRQPNWFPSGDRNWHFYYPYFYAIFGTHNSVNYIYQLVVQRLDSLGNPALGENGVVLTTWRTFGGFDYVHAVPDNEGVVGVFEKLFNPYYDVYAKRCYFDGTLGGPNAPIEDVAIEISGSDVILSWSAYADSADYCIRKSNEPYSFPIHPDTTVADTFYIDFGGMNEGNAFYDVRWQPRE